MFALRLNPEDREEEMLKLGISQCQKLEVIECAVPLIQVDRNKVRLSKCQQKPELQEQDTCNIAPDEGELETVWGWNSVSIHNFSIITKDHFLNSFM